MGSGSVRGECDARFEKVRELFGASFADGSEVGAAVAVSVEGVPVLDLWGGFVDKNESAPWERDTLVNVFSTTKGMTALCAHRLVDRGELDLDLPVATYWPEFAAAGKADIPVRWLLCHKAGLAAIERSLEPDDIYKWDVMTSALAEQAPLWVPGEAHGYHAVTAGWLVGEVVRRVSGKSLGTFFRDEIAGPLDADFWIGLPESEHGRVAPIGQMGMGKVQGDDEDVRLVMERMRSPDGLSMRAMANPPSILTGPNTKEWRSAEIPAANGHATARSLARVYGALACGGVLDGVEILSEEGLARCWTEQAVGPDKILGLRTRWSLGYMLTQDRPSARYGPNPRTFGHAGAGGSIGLADPIAKVSFGYVMNAMGPHPLLDPRAAVLLDAVYEAL